MRNHYQNFKYTHGDLQVFLVKKEELFSRIHNTFHIPEQPHDPPLIQNPLFDTFKQDFGDAISSNKSIYLEFLRVFMIIKTYSQLHEWVANNQKTQSMLRIFETKDNDNSIKTFNNKNTPPQLRYQGKISNNNNSQNN